MTTGPFPAERYVHALRGHVYRPVQPIPVTGGSLNGFGSTGGFPNHLGIKFSVGADASDVVVDAHAYESFPPSLVVYPLMSRAHADLGSDPQFPLTLTVEKSELLLTVEGVERVFTLYTCRDSAAAVTQVDRIAVTIEGPRAVVPQVELTRLDEASLRAIIDKSERELASNLVGQDIVDDA